MRRYSLKSKFEKFHFQEKLKQEVVNCAETLLDLGCGRSSPIKFFSNELKYSLGVDSHQIYINESIKYKIHTEYIVSDIIEACQSIADNSFDCVLALDVVEHLKKKTVKNY